jgi:3-hydroxyisobutyrate dehydrogenase
MNGDQRASLGWVGVGRMGRVLVMRLLDAGHEVAVYNRTREKAADLEQHGAIVVDAVADLADRDIVFTMVAGSDDVEEVVGDLLSRDDAHPGLIVDSTTISPAAAAAIRERAGQRGTAILAAPVSGNPKVAESGRLTIVVSGPADAWERARPYLEPLCRSITYVGEGESARPVPGRDHRSGRKGGRHPRRLPGIPQ